MSFAEARIEAYRISKALKGQPITEVDFINTTVGSLDIAIIAENRQIPTEYDVSEDEIERQLAQKGIIGLPKTVAHRTTDFKPVLVEGKPVSEMIIEERR
jgi:hypothetical protein